MTKVEAIVLSAAARCKMRSLSELAERSGTPYSSMRYKMRNPGTIRLSDLAAWNKHCAFTADEIREIVGVSG